VALRISEDSSSTKGKIMDENQMRGELRELSRALRRVHKAIADIELQYVSGPVSALEQLQILTNHPQLLWLQKLSALMAELDECMEEPDMAAADIAARFRTVIEQLIGPRAASDEDFRQRYNTLLHDGPDVAIAHGGLRAVLMRLPAAAE
jgi:phosphoenolpyruvate-protein kinase (PTS system EI component)